MGFGAYDVLGSSGLFAEVSVTGLQGRKDTGSKGRTLGPEP